MKRILAVLLLVAVITGCAGVDDVSIMPNDELIVRGNEAIQRRKYKRAVTYFRSVILNADNPDNARYAQRKMGDAYFLNGDFLDAIAAFEVYYDMYRNSDDFPYILYMLALSYSKISLSPPRDQTLTRTSVSYFNELKTNFPDRYEEYRAEQVRMEMIEKLALHEHFVARYYLRVNVPESAVMRLLYLINNYPDAEIARNAYILLISTTVRMGGRNDLARLYIDEFKERYPASASDVAQFERML